MLKKHKIFTVWQADKEARYMTQMIHQGNVLVRTTGVTKTFETTAPRPGTVQLDYQLDADVDDYLAITREAGWELLTDYPILNGKWLYLYHPDEHARLYSDNQTKIELLQRLRNRWTIFGLFCLIIALAILVPLGFVAFSFILPLVLVIVYVINFVCLTRQIKRLRSPLKN